MTTSSPWDRGSWETTATTDNVTLRLRADWPVGGRTAEEAERTRDRNRYAAALAGGVPPVALELATLPVPSRRPLLPLTSTRVDAKPRWSGKERRPYRSRRKLRTWER